MVCLGIRSHVHFLLLLLVHFLRITLSEANFSTSVPPNSFDASARHRWCEANPTHLLCGAISAVHTVLSHFPINANALIRHCDFFKFSPHCCAQFCLPGAGGTCDAATGACYCKPAGLPDVCDLLIHTEATSPGELTASDVGVLDACKQKCAVNPNSCTRAAASTDGLGVVCFCYCEPA